MAVIERKEWKVLVTLKRKPGEPMALTGEMSDMSFSRQLNVLRDGLLFAASSVTLTTADNPEHDVLVEVANQFGEEAKRIPEYNSGDRKMIDEVIYR